MAWTGDTAEEFILNRIYLRVKEWSMVIENNGGSVEHWLDQLEEMAKTS